MTNEPEALPEPFLSVERFRKRHGGVCGFVLLLRCRRFAFVGFVVVLLCLFRSTVLNLHTTSSPTPHLKALATMILRRGEDSMESGAGGLTLFGAKFLFFKKLFLK